MLSPKKCLLITAALMCLSSVGCGYETIRPGYVGLLVPYYGSKDDKTHYSTVYGRVWYNPWTYDVYTFPTFLQQVVWTADVAEGQGVDQSITFNSSEGKMINCDVALAYSIKEDEVPRIFREQRRSLDEITSVYLRSKVRDAFKRNAGQTPVHEIMGPGSEKLVDDVKKDLQDDLGPKGYVIDMVSVIGQMRVDAKVTEAISATITQQQKAIEAEAKIKQSEAEAKQAIAVAKGKADAAKAAAEGEAASILMKAEADAKANKLLQESLSSSLLQYQALKTWNGQLPQMLGGAAPIPFFDINKGLATPEPHPVKAAMKEVP